MSIGPKAPTVSADTRAREEAANARAEATRLESTQDALDLETRAIVRRFGALTGGGQPQLTTDFGDGGTAGPGLTQRLINRAQSPATGFAGGALRRNFFRGIIDRSLVGARR